MSNGLVMDTDLVNTSGNGINTSGTNFQEEVNNFRTHVNNIMGIWVGDDATEFQNVANDVSALLEKASVTVQEVGTHLVNTASAFDETVAENKSMFSGM